MPSFRERLRSDASSEVDPLALTRDEAYALLKLQRNIDALPTRQSWAKPVMNSCCKRQNPFLQVFLQ